MSKPNFVMVDDPVLYLIVRMEDQNRILSIMSRAGYYIKDVNTDRKVDGAYVTYTFTSKEKNMMELIGLGVAFAGFGLMMFLGAKGAAIERVSKAEAEAIRRKADHEFGKDKK